MAQAQPQPPKATDTVNLDLKDTDVRSAIEVLFRNTGKNFTVDQNVQGTIAALSIKDVPFDAALKSLAKSAGLVYRIDGGVYMISKRPDATTATVASAPVVDTNPVETPTTEPEIRIEKISLNNVSASEILSILGGGNRNYGGYGLGGNYGMYGGSGNGYGSSYGYGNNSYGGGNRWGGSGYGNSYGNGYGMNFQGGGYNNSSRYRGYGGSGYSGYGGNYGGGYRSW
jgi:type II secretory pathway component HofQ